MASYQRLHKLPQGYDDDGGEEHTTTTTTVAATLTGVLPLVLRSRSRRWGSRSWLRIRKASGRWRRVRLRIPGLRRLLRRKSRAVRAAVGKVVKRLKEGRPHIGELFTGNYMFMQVSPSPTMITSLEKSFLASYKQYYHHLQVLHHHGISSSSSTTTTTTTTTKPMAI